MEFLLKPSEGHDRPPYDALSYTWGNPKQVSLGSFDAYSTRHKYAVAINGRLFYVTKNLYDALYRLQEHNIAPGNIDQRSDLYKKTRLIEAAEQGNLEQVTECLDQGANYHCQDKFGETALHYAAENGYPEIVKLLLRKGASPTILDYNRRDPLNCCLQQKRRQWKDAAEILRNWDVQDKGQSIPVESVTKTGGPIWIDAICINQNDIPERNSQVAMMSQIYGSARCVIAWLGEADESTQVAYNFFSPKLTVDPEKYTKFFERWNSGERFSLDDKPDDVAMSMGEMQAIRNLLSRTWFSRTWVIQEVSLAKEIHIICGRFQFQWGELFTLLFELFNERRTRSLLSYGGQPIKFERASPGTEVLSLFDIRIRTGPDCSEAQRARRLFPDQPTSRSQYEQKLSLPALILLTWNFSVSDPRDKIFALLIMSKPLEGISADYSKSVTEVFTNMGKILIKAEGDDTVHTWDRYTMMEDLEPLESLSFVHPILSFRHDGQPADLPSWVPTFSRQLVSQRIYDKLYTASGDRQAVFYHSEPRILKLDGLLVDTIAELEKSSSQSILGRLIDDNTVEKWLEIVSRLSPIYPTRESRIEALWRTLAQDKHDRWRILSQDTKDRVMSKMTKGLFRSILHQCIVKHQREKCSERHLRLCQVLDELRTSEPSSLLPSPSEVMSSNESLSDKNEDVVRKTVSDLENGFRNHVSEYLKERSLMRTEGGYLGITSEKAKLKDCVVLLAGGRTPFILRPTSADQFTYIGEAYIHGMMFGERLKGKEHKFGPIEIS